MGMNQRTLPQKSAYPAANAKKATVMPTSTKSFMRDHPRF